MSHTPVEILTAAALVVVLAAAAVAAVRPLGGLRERWETAWPAAIAIAMSLVFFVVPYQMGGVSGLNERIPVYAAMLAIPCVPAAGRVARGLVRAALPFAAYTIAVNALVVEARPRAVLRAADRFPFEAGSEIYPVVLDFKQSSLAVDLGRHLIQDIARRKDLVTGKAFYGHPAFPLRATPRTPPHHDDAPVQDFAHMNERERRDALADPSSPIRKMLRVVAEQAPHARYLVVIRSSILDAAFSQLVLEPLGYEALPGTTEDLGIYARRPESPLRISALDEARRR